ncbi:hypothetical protein LOK49_LG04G00253 [Camellia lanceoleosa]|uniref:Uncharacterized protein n=1 Tax=Camellia lanceoleosa TaxID=1840588 RepID=A0ACC0I5Q1_9ERIC|nr:hypothetical protein LOK49_LG04G00253 [Camellia lanceoleosa]
MCVSSEDAHKLWFIFLFERIIFGLARSKQSNDQCGIWRRLSESLFVAQDALLVLWTGSSIPDGFGCWD